MSFRPHPCAARRLPAFLCAFLFTGASLLAFDEQLTVQAGAKGRPISRYLTGSCIEDVNHEIYGGLYSQMIFGESFQEDADSVGLSHEWHPIRTGTAAGEMRIETDRPFVGRQSQRLTYSEGTGGFGLSNGGLFGRPPGKEADATGLKGLGGMNFVAGKPYEGSLCVRAAQACDLTVSLENAAGDKVYARAPLHVAAGDQWMKLAFMLTPDAADTAGRFAITLAAPGSVVLGYAFLQPGPWGRFHGLPERRDIVEGMIEQGVTVLRYGGSMVNVPGYRWKDMLGPREKRPPYKGNWYPYSSNGWGIPDFIAMCDAAGFLAIPDLSLDETPQDVLDLIEYANGPANTPWGKRRLEDGHPKPYGLHVIEIGNEQRVDESYWKKFQAIAQAVWAKDPGMILAVGDFAYSKPIVDPFHFSGAASGITTLAAHQQILALARQYGSEVWFDMHIGTGAPRDNGDALEAAPSFISALDKLAEGAKHHVVIFELNADNHQQKRALANAAAIEAAETLGGALPVVTSANGLQADGHNDNAWNQGLLFFNSATVWLQPSGYVTRMISRHYQPWLADCTVVPGDPRLRVCATRSEDGKVLVLQVTNARHSPVVAQISLPGFVPAAEKTKVVELAGAPNGVNTADSPRQIAPRSVPWPSQATEPAGESAYTFPPDSFTILSFAQ